MKDGQLLLSVDRFSLSGTGIVLALLAGFVASVAMVIAFAVAYLAAVALSGIPIPILASWFHGLTSNRLINVAGPNLYAATVLFFVGGLIWALLFAVAFDHRLRGRTWERGVQFALIPWAFSLIVLMPLVGGGFLGIDLGAGPLPIVGNLVLHVVYGAVLGTILGSAESVIDRPLGNAFIEDMQVGRLSEIGAARGLGVGLAIGVILGLVAATLVPQSIGMNPLAVIVAIGLSCSAFGSFVGSLATN